MLAEEFADWTDSARRIDLLCLDREARLVVVELKRDEEGGHMELQAIQDKQKLRWAEIIQAINRLFEGDVIDGDAVTYVDSVIKGELLESPMLRDKAAANTKEQFSNSPTLQSELTGSIIDAMAAHQKMSTQALGSEIVRAGILSALMGPGLLWERLREGGIGS